MAKLNGPLLSFTARGQVGQDTIYQKRRGQAVAKSYAVPAQPHSQVQTDRRQVFTTIGDIYAAAGPGWQEAIKLHANALKLPQRNVLVKWNLATGYADMNMFRWVFMHKLNASILNLPLAVSPGANAVTLTLDDGPIPAAWSIEQAILVALPFFNPRSGPPYAVLEADVPNPPYAHTFSGLNTSFDYWCGGFFIVRKPDGKRAVTASTQLNYHNP